MKGAGQIALVGVQGQADDFNEITPEGWVCLAIVAAILIVGLIVHVLKKRKEAAMAARQGMVKAEQHRRWAMIHGGMSKDEVLAILGQPRKVKSNTAWYDPIFRGRDVEEWSWGWLNGKVTFKKGRVVAFKQPVELDGGT